MGITISVSYSSSQQPELLKRVFDDRMIALLIMIASMAFQGVNKEAEFYL